MVTWDFKIFYHPISVPDELDNHLPVLASEEKSALFFTTSMYPMAKFSSTLTAEMEHHDPDFLFIAKIS